jgi:hypothetical protein
MFDISLDIRHELGKDNTSQNNLVQIKSLYILYRRVFASVQHTFLTCMRCLYIVDFKKRTAL